MRGPGGPRVVGCRLVAPSARCHRLESAGSHDRLVLILVANCVTKDCRKRHIGDFPKWKLHDDYTRAFDRLVRGLKKSQTPIIMKGG